MQMKPAMLALVLVFALNVPGVFVSPSGAEDEKFLQITGPCNLEFPRDHGAHLGYQTEWWYYTGNLEAEDGRRFGFQFTVFRRQLKPGEDESDVRAESRSAWRTNQIYLGHAAVSDIGERKHYHAETMARGMEMLAGVNQNGDTTTRIFLKTWEAAIGREQHRLRAGGKDFHYALELVPEKPPIPHGDAGYSRKGSTAERASCYYSFTRLRVSGTLDIGGERIGVQGLAWMDQEFSSAYLEPGLEGWDWFSLQLSDGTDVMVFLLRKEDGGLSPASSGTFVDATGRAVHLNRDDFALTPEKNWKSPRSKAVYPIQWKIEILPLNLRLDLEAAFPEQEMETTGTTGVTYWEGSVTVEGARQGMPIHGRGYLEMTGRTGAGFEAPL